MRRARALFVLLGALTMSAGCREPRANVGDGPYADKVAADIPQIEEAMGVKFKRPPKLEIRSHDQVREFLLARMREPDAVKQIANQEAMYKVLGLVPDTLHLADLMVKLLTEQIVGYYDPRTKVLYVVQGMPDDIVGITVMHELVHALQDQYVNLDSLEHITGDDDRAAAAQAVVEGEAMYEQLYIMSGGGNNIANQFPGGWETMRQTIRDNVKSQPIFSSAPRALQESMLFPYINGADFVRRFKARYGKRLPLDSLPITTEQLMHEAAFFGKKDIPSEITLPPIAGTVDQNDMGEFGTRIYIYSHTRVEDMSIRASNGWDGDRYALVKTPAGYGLVWVSVWDQRQDGIEFIDAIDQVMRARFNRLPRVTGELRRYEGDKRTVEVNVREVNGRPVVLYVDVPAGSSTNLVDFSKVKVVPK
jgi:hypothetical protein